MARQSCLIMALIALAMGFGVILLTRRDQTFGPRSRVRIDDFAFTVETLEHCKGRLRVSLTIHNEAQRVSFDFDPALIVLTDDSGSIVPAKGVPGKRAFFQLAAGSSAPVLLEFPEPKAGQHAYLEWSFGGGLGRFADKILFGRKRARII